MVGWNFRFTYLLDKNIYVNLMGIICHKHEMQQIVLKENIPHPNHNKDEGRRGRISKPWHYV